MKGFKVAQENEAMRDLTSHGLFYCITCWDGEIRLQGHINDKTLSIVDKYLKSKGEKVTYDNESKWMSASTVEDGVHVEITLTLEA